MGRRIQGFIHRVKHDENQKKAEDAEQQNNQETDKARIQNTDMVNISQEQLVSGIVSGLAKATELPCSVQQEKPSMEISEELISMMVEKIQERQQKNNQTQVDKPDTKQASQSEQLQTLVAKLLLGAKGAQEKQNNGNSQQADNPILAANDNANRSSNKQDAGSLNDTNLKTNMTAKIATQVLAEAQYELSKELESSLHKLKQVIEESKQVAQKISNLLGQKGQ